MTIRPNLDEAMLFQIGQRLDQIGAAPAPLANALNFLEGPKACFKKLDNVIGADAVSGGAARRDKHTHDE